MIQPHGGSLVDRTVSTKEQARIIESFEDYPSLQLDKEDAQEIDNMAYGVFSPLNGFLTQAEFESVLDHGRLPKDVPWTIPIVLDIHTSSR